MMPALQCILTVFYRSPLQETLDIAASASEMATLVSQKEGVELDDFEPGQAKKKKVVSNFFFKYCVTTVASHCRNDSSSCRF